MFTETSEVRSLDRSRSSEIVGRAWLLVGAAFVVHVCIAPLRHLTFDEAYYAWASKMGVPWPVPHHPPLLGILLRLVPDIEPLELRVRLVPIVLSSLTSLGVARLAALIAPRTHRAEAFLAAVLLSSWGLMPMAGGVQAIPEAPLLASLAWLLVTATWCTQDLRCRRESAILPLAVLAACAVGSKMSALPCVFAIAAGLISRRAWPQAVSVVLGALAALPFGLASLEGQSAHALGRGPWLTSPSIGVGASLGIITVAIVLVFGPIAIALGVKGRETMRRIPGGVGVAVLIALAIATSAIVSGRMPEVHWFAPATIPLYAAAATPLATMSARWRARALFAHVAPAMLGLVLWCVPNVKLERSSDFFVTAAHVTSTNWQKAASESRTIPAYGSESWQRLYGRP